MRRIAIVAICLFVSCKIAGQVIIDNKRDFVWVGGSEAHPVWRPSSFFDFNSNPLNISHRLLQACFYLTNSSICDRNGQYLFSTNGLSVLDASNHIMENGDTLNPSTYSTSVYGMGYTQYNCAVTLPLPGNDRFYYIFHLRIVWDPNPSVMGYVNDVMYTLIDMEVNNGLGRVVDKKKNVSLLSDTIHAGPIAAVRHANGRDWWIFCRKRESPEFIRIFLGPNGPRVDGTQTIGRLFYKNGLGNMCFSPDGTKCVYHRGVYTDKPNMLEYYKFDRCTGLFSDCDSLLSTTDSLHHSHTGIAISPNSRFLYYAHGARLYQYDLDAADVSATRTEIAEVASLPGPNCGNNHWVYLANLALAPDGKIYVSSGACPTRHVINFPDNPGLSCGFSLNAISLPVRDNYSIPYFPSFRLGPVLGSVCDSLAMGEAELQNHPATSLSVYPNPASDVLQLEIKAADFSPAREIRICNVLGQNIFQSRLAPFQSLLRTDVSAWPGGIYTASLYEEGAMLHSIRFVVRR